MTNSSARWRSQGVRIVRPGEFDSNIAQTPGLHRLAAVSEQSTGAKKLWAGTFTVDAQAKTGPHHHGDLETVIYVLNGIARLRWGEHLEFEAEAAAGDFIYVPPYVRIRRSIRALSCSCSACWSAAGRKVSYSTWTSRARRRLSWSDGSTTCIYIK
jgi:uncharacterized RmlC-like cupin family protein